MRPLKLKEIKKIFERNKYRYLNADGVMGVDIGYKIEERNKRVLENTLAIRIHVHQKKEENILPPIQIIEKEIDGVITDVIQANLTQQGYRDFTVSDLRTLRRNTLIGGISIGGADKESYGTLGAVVFDVEKDTPMILSNHHVLRDANNPNQLGTEIFQPAIPHLYEDFTEEECIVGKLTRTGVEDGLDCAVAEIKNRTGINRIYKLGEIKGVIPPRLGLKLKKSGVKTDITYGVVDGIYWTGYANQDAKKENRFLKNVIHIIPLIGLDSEEEISYPGDSGSIWVTENMYAVGLHFTGENFYNNPIEFALAYPITYVMKLLKVTFKK